MLKALLPWVIDCEYLILVSAIFQFFESEREDQVKIEREKNLSVFLDNLLKMPCKHTLHRYRNTYRTVKLVTLQEWGYFMTNIHYKVVTLQRRGCCPWKATSWSNLVTEGCSMTNQNNLTFWQLQFNKKCCGTWILFT